MRRPPLTGRATTRSNHFVRAAPVCTLSAMTDTQDTIVAVATAPGKGGIGVIRLSGPAAANIAARVLRPGLLLTPRHAHFSAFLDASGEQIDEGLALFFPGHTLLPAKTL